MRTGGEMHDAAGIVLYQVLRQLVRIQMESVRAVGVDLMLPYSVSRESE